MIRVSLMLSILFLLFCSASSGSLPVARNSVVQRTDHLSERISRVEAGLIPAGDPQTTSLNLADRMRFYKVPGLSIAVIDAGRVEWARGYGVLELGTKRPVTPDTLFQACSISKPIAAMAALRHTTS
jgi:CubicO group peptidase (beta-lactamase class C family)